ncbi:MAG: hypothetical protein AB7K04_01940 [Pseudorhodoplanes sp.]
MNPREKAILNLKASRANARLSKAVTLDARPAMLLRADTFIDVLRADPALIEWRKVEGEDFVPASRDADYVPSHDMNFDRRANWRARVAGFVSLRGMIGGA